MGKLTDKDEHATQQVVSGVVTHLVDSLNSEQGEWLVGGQDEFYVHTLHDSSGQEGTVWFKLVEEDKDGEPKRALIMKVKLVIESVIESVEEVPLVG